MKNDGICSDMPVDSKVQDQGGTMKQHLAAERARHNEGMLRRLDDLQRHYERMPNTQYTR